MKLSVKQKTIRGLFCFLFAALFLLIGLKGITAGREDEKKRFRFCATINCMDGRCQRIVNDYALKLSGTDFVDVITEAGPSKILAKKPKTDFEKFLVENIRRRLEISVKYHGTKVVIIDAHDDCKGNSGTKEEQIEDLRQAKKTVDNFNLNVKVILLWIGKDFKEPEVIE